MRDIIYVNKPFISPYIGKWAKEFCEEHNYQLDSIKAKTRVAWLCRQRNHFCYAAVGKGFWSLPRIGGFINRHHTTVINSVWRHGLNNNLPPLTSSRGYARKANMRLHDPFRDVDEKMSQDEYISKASL